MIRAFLDGNIGKGALGCLAVFAGTSLITGKKKDPRLASAGESTINQRPKPKNQLRQRITMTMLNNQSQQQAQPLTA